MPVTVCTALVPVAEIPAALAHDGPPGAYDCCPDCPHCGAWQSLIVPLQEIDWLYCVECEGHFDMGRLLACEDDWEPIVAWMEAARKRLAGGLARSA